MRSTRIQSLQFGDGYVASTDLDRLTLFCHFKVGTQVLLELSDIRGLYVGLLYGSIVVYELVNSKTWQILV